MQTPRTIDNTVLLIVGTVMLGTLFGSLTLFGQGTASPWSEALAPLAAGAVLIVAYICLTYIERRMAGENGGWPPVLFAFPLVGVACMLAYAWVNPTHQWKGDAIIGAFWGGVVALVAWGRWRSRSAKLEAQRTT